PRSGRGLNDPSVRWSSGTGDGQHHLPIELELRMPGSDLRDDFPELPPDVDGRRSGTDSQIDHEVTGRRGQRRRSSPSTLDPAYLALRCHQPRGVVGGVMREPLFEILDHCCRMHDGIAVRYPVSGSHVPVEAAHPYSAPTK